MINATRWLTFLTCGLLAGVAVGVIFGFACAAWDFRYSQVDPGAPGLVYLGYGTVLGLVGSVLGMITAAALNVARSRAATKNVIGSAAVLLCTCVAFLLWAGCWLR